MHDKYCMIVYVTKLYRESGSAALSYISIQKHTSGNKLQSSPQSAATELFEERVRRERFLRATVHCVRINVTDGND